MLGASLQTKSVISSPFDFKIAPVREKTLICFEFMIINEPKKESRLFPRKERTRSRKSPKTPQQDTR